MITIDDQGPGILSQALARVLQPFYRMEVSRKPATGSIGFQSRGNVRNVVNALV